MYRFDLKKKKLKIVLDGLNETKRTLSLFYISTYPPVHSPSADEAAYTSFLKIINGNDSKKSQNWTKTMQFQNHVNVFLLKESSQTDTK